MFNWITQTFEASPYGDGNVIVAENEYGKVGVDPNWLTSQLNSSAVPPTYDFLKSTSLYVSGGWSWIIEQWKTRGLIQ